MPELFEIHQRDDNGVPVRFWRYTNAKRAVTLNAESFSALTINAGDWQRQLREGRAEIEVPADMQPFPIYLAGDPGQAVWVKVMEVDGSPLFFGKVSNVEHRLFRRRCVVRLDSSADTISGDLPLRNYDPSCDWRLFGPGCELSSSAYRKEVDISIVTISSDGLTLTSPAFETKADEDTAPQHYWIGGRIDRGIESRAISASDGDTIKLLSRFHVNDGATLVVYPGCNKSMENCRDKFGNLAKFSGYRRVPTKNPHTDGYARKG